MRKLVFALLMLMSITVFAQFEMPKMVPEMTEIWDPEVALVTPGETPLNAPSDAIILIGEGIDLGYEWTNDAGENPGWDYENGVATVKRGTGGIKTKRQFKDFQLHVEWRTPAEVVGESQGRGNSGIFLQGIYEVQVLDNYNNRTYRNGQAGSIYKQHAPLVNACKEPGVWQTYDIIYTAPRFNDDGSYFTHPRITVIQNGVLVQNHVVVRGPTEYIGIPEYSVKPHGNGPISLQDHGNPVSFRNIWIREL
ncbi:3-keto-disaccharide hydrolase [Gaoshiqia sp. Z1-71]|uniref:3-keto-disaccharide hydrolase n=1 Tax=Gaoshiqia hydrogeniformans TaxID=3290090 RepID=UPI003BF80B08